MNTLEHMDTVKSSEVAVDVFCHICHINEYRYNYRKQDKLVCKWCHDRLEFPHLADKTDQELDEMRKTKQSVRKRSIVNAENLIGFK